ncbi:hypothetical protein V2J09_003867 [Rumex salicifolius]
MERLFILLVLLPFLLHRTSAGLIAEPVTDPGQPLRPVDSSSPNTVPAFPVQSSRSEFCHLDLSDELFGGVNDACGHNLDRSRCCPVLAAWLFAAYARSALSISPAPSPSPSPSSGISSPADVSDLPMMPDDSQRCVDSLQTSLLKRSIKIPQPNASCDAVLCFCGIRLHQITSLSCPAAFNVTPPLRNATAMASVRNLEKSCRNSSYSGCTKCLGALQKLKVEEKNGTSSTSRATKMFNRDCKLMGLTWLLARNKTAYIPTVSAVLRAMLYSPHPHENRCSPDQENMPLAVDSLQFENSASSPSLVSFTVLPLLLAVYYCLFSILARLRRREVDFVIHKFYSFLDQ